MDQNFQTQMQTANPGKRNLPRDVFLHLFAMVALYWSAVSFITLCWQYINYFFPDVLSLRYSYQSYVGPIRFSVASLIIIFPLFILASWYLNKIYGREIVVRESKIRKWLIYLTLFITSLIIIGDLVTVIYNLLGGDVTAKFILKALSVLVVAGVVFGYYLDDVRRQEPSKLAKYFVWVTSAIILIAVIGAFFIVGSPKQARLLQLDQQRISDLQNIQGQIVNYWQRKEQLPNNVSDLSDSISGYIVPNDPETNKPYEYSVKVPKPRDGAGIPVAEGDLGNAADLKFELCAAFTLDSKNQEGLRGTKSIPAYPNSYGEYQQNWDHSAGRVCFERTIDKQLYPPLNGGKIKALE